MATRGRATDSQLSKTRAESLSEAQASESVSYKARGAAIAESLSEVLEDLVGRLLCSDSGAESVTAEPLGEVWDRAASCHEGRGAVSAESPQEVRGSSKACAEHVPADASARLLSLSVGFRIAQANRESEGEQGCKF